MGLLPPNYSMFSSLALSVVTVAAMQMFKDQIAVEGNLIRLSIGGFAGSWLFVFLVTALGNFYAITFPRNAHVSLFPEILVVLFVAVVASALVHRICATTCIIFSLIALYYLNKISQSAASAPSTTTYSSAGPPANARGGKPQSNGKTPSTPKNRNKKR